MDSRIAVHPQLNFALRQTEEAPPDRSPPATRWFYIVDVEATAAEEPHALRDGRVVLGLSATRADANAATNAEGLGVVYYADLDKTEQRDMAARIDASRHGGPEHPEMPKTNGVR